LLTLFPFHPVLQVEMGTRGERGFAWLAVLCLKSFAIPGGYDLPGTNARQARQSGRIP